MNDGVKYIKVSNVATTTLANALTLTANTITVANAAGLFSPNVSAVIPGVIFVNGERITYWTITGNTLGQITRGTLGTGANAHAAGSTVVSGSSNFYVPSSNNTVYTFGANTTELTTATVDGVSNVYYTFLAGTGYIETNSWYSLGATTATNGNGLAASTTTQALFIKS
jgi:hypothetical protein